MEEYSGNFYLKNMIELIKVTTNAQNEQLVSARDLHQFLVKDAKGGQKGQDFTHWIKDKIDLGFKIGKDYTSVGYDYLGNIVEENGVAKNSELDNQQVRVDKRDYILTLDFAKHISMVQRNDKGEEARNYFLMCEKKLMNLKLPTTYKEALLALVEAEEQKELAQKQIEEQKEIIEIQAPKVESFDKFIDADGLYSVNDAAKSLGVGQKKLFEALRESKILNRENVPYQKFLDSEYFKVKTSTINAINRNVKTPKVTPKGLHWLRKLIQEEKINIKK
jgi:anti-repressor protein